MIAAVHAKKWQQDTTAHVNIGAYVEKNKSIKYAIIFWKCILEQFSDNNLTKQSQYSHLSAGIAILKIRKKLKWLCF